MSRRWHGGVLFLLAAASAGCGSEDSNDPGDNCTGLAPISVSSGAPPVFTWAAACDLDRIEVMDSATYSMAWNIATPGNAISPPVTFGIKPPGASTGPSGGPPASGATAMLTLHRLGNPDMADTAYFVWP